MQYLLYIRNVCENYKKKYRIIFRLYVKNNVKKVKNTEWKKRKTRNQKGEKHGIRLTDKKYDTILESEEV